MADKKTTSRKSKQQKHLYLSNEVVAQLEKASGKRGTTLSDYVDHVLYEHFNQDVHTQEAVFNELSQIKHVTNRIKQQGQVSLELVAMLFESYLMRAPEIPQEHKASLAAKIQQQMQRIIEVAAKRATSANQISLPDDRQTNEDIEEAMRMLEDDESDRH